MRYLPKLCWAELRCSLYLLTQGMWRGERRYTFTRGWRTEEVAACKGSIHDITITRRFYP